MYSDNGTNFVGADKDFQSFLKSEEFKTKMLEFSTSEHVRWHFIPPRSPHFGGLWESVVRSMKLHLRHTIGDAFLTVTEMMTVLIQVEAILNSRPMSPLSEDPDDFNALTPGHFLIGDNLKAYPEEDLREVQINRLSRWQHVEQIRQHFWTRWRRDYLTTCQQRGKWNKDQRAEWRVGQLVMLKDDTAMPLKWTLSRIVELHPGSDGIVRAIT